MTTPTEREVLAELVACQADQSAHYRAVLTMDSHAADEASYRLGVRWKSAWAAARALVSQPALSRDQVPHNPHPKAPHGFDRGNAHSLGRYVCYCENWAPAQEAAQHVSAQGPAELWLQLHGESMELDEPVDYTDGVTWCWEQIYEGDVRYVRAELLDWLDSNGCTDVHKLGNRWYVRQGYGSPVHRSDTLRDAIRAAIAAQGEPK